VPSTANISGKKFASQKPHDEGDAESHSNVETVVRLAMALQWAKRFRKKGLRPPTSHWSPATSKSEALSMAVEAAGNLQGDQRAFALAMLVPHLKGKHRTEAFADALEAFKTVKDDLNRGQWLVRIGGAVLEDRQRKAIFESIKGIKNQDIRDWALEKLGFSNDNNIAKDKESAKLSLPDTLGQTVGQVPRATSSDELLDRYLAESGVPPGQRQPLILKIQYLIAPTVRHKWRDRKRFEDLRALSAPRFLKQVHSAEIGPDGTIHKDAIRSIDPALMEAVETYISQRRRRGSDLGDASDLVFVTSRPAHKKASRDVTFRGRTASSVVDALRASGRRGMKALRQKRMG
jgi:hypothetical protein